MDDASRSERTERLALRERTSASGRARLWPRSPLPLRARGWRGRHASTSSRSAAPAGAPEPVNRAVGARGAKGDGSLRLRLRTGARRELGYPRSRRCAPKVSWQDEGSSALPNVTRARFARIDETLQWIKRNARGFRIRSKLRGASTFISAAWSRTRQGAESPTREPEAPSPHGVSEPSAAGMLEDPAAAHRALAR